MTDARLEPVYADKIRAREFLDQATRFLADARGGTLSAPSRILLLHNAAISACDAILQANGLRVTPRDRSHILRLETALQQLDADTEELLERLDASRERRNEASYAAASSPKPASSTPKKQPPSSSNSRMPPSATAATQPPEHARDPESQPQAATPLRHSPQ